MNLWIGIALAVLAALINGNFAVPLKGAKTWAWENSWAVYSLVALLIFPWGLAWFTIPRLAETYSALSAAQILTPLLFGTGWGISQVLLGISVARVGMALTFAIVIGLSASLGTLIPLLSLDPGVFLSAKGISVLTALVIMAVGIFLCAWAGREREAVETTSASQG